MFYRHLQVLLSTIVLFSLLLAPSTADAQMPDESPELLDLAWSPDGSMIVGGGTDGIVRLWDAETGEVIYDLQGVENNVYAVAWNPDSTTFASAGGDNLIHIWDVETREEIATLEGHLALIISIGWSPDGSQIASASFSQYAYDSASLRIWDTSIYQQIYGIDIGSLTEVVWNPSSTDSEVAVSNVNRFIAVREVTNVELPRRIRFEGNAGQYSIAWSPDTSTLASGDVDGTIYLIEASSGDLITSFNADTTPITEVIWKPDGTQLASSSLDGTIRFWDTTDWTLIDSIEVDDLQYTPPIAWSPDGAQFVYGTANAEINIIAAP